MILCHEKPIKYNTANKLHAILRTFVDQLGGMGPIDLRFQDVKPLEKLYEKLEVSKFFERSHRDAAFNALLKTLEEPSDNTYLILAASRSDRLPRTILSRSARLQLPSRIRD